jgi:hypothetical protein
MVTYASRENGEDGSTVRATRSDVETCKRLVTMSAANLVDKLVEIERAIGRATTADVHAMVLEAQGCVLDIQRQLIDTLRENARLRERMEKCEPTSMARLREVLLPSNAEVAWELARRVRPAPEDTTAALPIHLAAS